MRMDVTSFELLLSKVAPRSENSMSRYCYAKKYSRRRTYGIEIEMAVKRYVCAYIYAYTVSLLYAKFNRNAVDFVACGERAHG